MKTWLSLNTLLRALIAFVFLQSLLFKFSGSPETVHIFSTLGTWSGLAWFGTYGAYGVGMAELIASVLLFSRWQGYGALLSLGIISGAIFFHLFTPLGIAMPEFDAQGMIIGDDGGALFGMACLVWASAATLSVRFLRQKNPPIADPEYL
ncbi:hypothetical protein KDD30_22465 (plasmid) [Photobacterium sp. GJ3]|uniref:hypothetical protein n=1 Tax=Photobacterium sp. GJ3 TaxID=2829502 RepID=UPI001B8BF5D2|nr:hypothetical protein [Photobacterium sp. GJ3]QUJ69516.1 hypothetical protein KDD30_22465 [Photobacterium sp. GJ3]